jgi:hypothetical protein
VGFQRAAVGAIYRGNSSWVSGARILAESISNSKLNPQAEIRESGQVTWCEDGSQWVLTRVGVG